MHATVFIISVVNFRCSGQWSVAILVSGHRAVVVSGQMPRSNMNFRYCAGTVHIHYFGNTMNRIPYMYIRVQHAVYGLHCTTYTVQTCTTYIVRHTLYDIH